MSDRVQFRNFSEFYSFYIDEHRNRTSRRLQVSGTGLVAVLAIAAVSRDRRYALLIPPAGYGFAWVGHFFFEKNRPATFKHPVWSLLGDLRLFAETVSFRRAF